MTWKVKVGDVIKVNDIVVEIETAKSLVELPSPYAGTVQALHVPEGETVPVGTPIITIGEGAAAPVAAPTPTEPTAQTESDPYLGLAEKAGAQQRAAEPVPAIDMSNPAATGGGENQTLVGYGPRTASAQRRPRRGGASPASDAGAAAQLQVQGAFGQGGAETADVVEADEPAVPATPAAHHEPAAPSDVRVLAKPPVRKLAKDLGVDLRTLTPSGVQGTVTREDVLAATSADVSGGDVAPATSVPDGSVVRGEGDRREPIKGVRKMMAQAMVDSAFTAPHVTEWITVDVTKTMRLVEKLRAHRDFRDV